MSEQAAYGGQAVLEGVMMRGPERLAIAVRRPDGQIAIKEEKVTSVTKKYPILGLPVVRGMVMMVETLSIGIGALMYSANEAMPDEEQLSKKEMTLTTTLGMVLALGVFVGIPTLITHWMHWAPHSLAANAAEGVIRLGLFIGYLAGVAALKDIQRVYQYHGAEHKVINTLESGDPLEVEYARKHSREHKRCGTSFLLYVVVISIVLFTFFSFSSVWLRLLTRLALMPVIAGISYELLRMLGKYNNGVTMAISRPGMWLQGLTTREPDDSQLEVAIAALQSARGFGLPG
ncbi:MAG TPA: DUF1385 domain-containing protein [Symbiobacteriaceae bacterium]